jgi:osmoprotectant transport system permease protein
MDAFGELWDFVTTSANWSGPRGIVHRTYEHVRLSGAAAAVAALLALPPAAALGHVRRGGLLAVSVVNIGRALPSFGIVALALPLSIEWGFGLGFWPTFAALVLLGIPPIFTNAYTGVRGVDPDTVEAAVGVGMSRRDVLLRVEVPNALPLILTGLRVSTVQIVATATLGALVGYPCLGSYVVEGLAQPDDGKLLTGAVAVALLAIATEVAFSTVERIATPWTRARGRRGPRVPRIAMQVPRQRSLTP